MQLIQALQRAARSFEVQVDPTLGIPGVNPAAMMEFFIENLVINPPKAHAALAGWGVAPSPTSHSAVGTAFLSLPVRTRRDLDESRFAARHAREADARRARASG